MTVNIKHAKERLQVKEKELQESIAGLTEAYPEPVDSSQADEGPQEFEEKAVDFLETQQEQSIMVNQQALLQQVTDALKRIEDGTYGRCIDCGKPIPEKRLEALPWAARCVQDEEKLEKQNLSREDLYGDKWQP
ncbi:TraR/DksA family transcriptional regulator [Ktedonospora formicarum]|uniref:Zinc finger DksA/TraR C4-type domain-containing protein n=1 Tax=Ktedonospora formicarum TaxID=2778364 RepID=A0A8J3HRI3_9CHLR|nr:TraR/DksA C4-type zinc finger protein [Ktedonospora formicarum]GHO42527.1 hypothetical protein KSX_06900 [Ktedonospora formicarum]